MAQIRFRVIAALALTILPAASYAAGITTAPRMYTQAAPLPLLPVLSEEQLGNSEQTFSLEDLLSNIDGFVKTPKDGLAWQILGETKEIPYAHIDKDGVEWSGVRPDFPANLKALDGASVLMQGYMFPLGPDEKQPEFLFGPFPISCPYHYHVTSNLMIEVHAKTPVTFSYDAVNIRGTLELVPEDDENNVFFRLRDAVLVPADKS